MYKIFIIFAFCLACQDVNVIVDCKSVECFDSDIAIIEGNKLTCIWDNVNYKERTNADIKLVFHYKDGCWQGPEETIK